MTSTSTIIDALKHIPLFAQCRDSFLQNLAAQAQIISKTRKGQVLFVHQEPAKRFYAIRGGWVKLFRETLDGTQAIVDILPTGHIFGETSLFEDDIYPYSAEVAEAGEFISLPLSVLKSEIEANPQMALSMLSAMARYRKQQDMELEHRTLQNAPQRIGCFFLRLTKDPLQGSVQLHLPYDKMLVASRLGMQPETFSRALTKLKEATGLRIKGATVEIDDIKKLSHFSCSACSSEFPCHDLPKKACS